MTLNLKRILIFFSVALNIGFLAMAGVNAWDRSTPKKERRWNELKTMVLELNLPREKADRVIDLMATFRDQMEVMDKAYKASRLEILAFLSRPEPLDRQGFHRLLLGSDRHEVKKRELFESHVLALRQVLGDTDGARFFARLKTHLESRRGAPRS